MQRLVTGAIDRGWAAPAATDYAFDFASRVIDALRQPRSLQ
jgi:hypothetical protein